MRSRLPEMTIVSLSRYANSLSESTYVKARSRGGKRNQLLALRKLENALVVGNWLFNEIYLIERNWRQEILAGKTDYDLMEDASIREFYWQWSQPCRQCLNEIAVFEGAHMRVHEAAKFRKHCQEASETLSRSVPPMKDEDLMKWNQIVERAKPNPRPVRVDIEGRVFELTGERISLDCLDPRKVAKGMKDESEGRTRSLREVVADRRK